MAHSKTISLPADYLIHQDRDAIRDEISELIYSYLKEIGCKTESYSWSIEVQYMEEENNYQQYVNAAKQTWEDTDVEIDANPRISVSDDGAWVQSWLWVDNYQIGENK